MTNTTVSGLPTSVGILGAPTLIPEFHNGVFTGRPFRIDQVLSRNEKKGARLHVWFGPDDRIHNHPWEWISCDILRGSYTAHQYTARPSGNHDFEIVKHTVEGINPIVLHHQNYHKIVEVEPGTISVMTFGPQIGDGKQWGHLVPKEQGTLRYEPSTENPELPAFLNAFRYLNPHARPTGWTVPDEIVKAYGAEPKTVKEWLATIGL